MQSVLDECRRLFGPTPRCFERWAARRYLHAAPPGWLRRQRQHPLWESHRQEQQLFREGEITWGCLVQAHQRLWNNGKTDYPALVIYRPGPAFDDRADELNLLGIRLHEVKRARPDDPEERRFTEMLDDVYSCEMGLPVPPSISGDTPCASTLIMVHRKHLPDGVLVKQTVPLLILPAVTPAAIILPSRYWPPALLYAWGACETAPTGYLD